MPRLDGPFPQPFCHFTVQEMLGEGGMAAVYRALDTRTGREVALKLPHPEMLETPAGRQRFRAEASIGLRLCHPNCCRVLEYVEAGDSNRGSAEEVPAETYLVLPLMRGGSLEQRLTNHGLLSPQKAAKLTLEIARALDFVHSQGIVHADLKPNNILFASGNDDEPILVDFGIAIDLADPDTPLPRPGVLEGVLLYLAPQQIDRVPGESIGPSCDLWALGVVFYQLLTGTHPFLQAQQQPPPVASPPWFRGWLRRWFGGSEPAAKTTIPAAPPHPVIELLTSILTQEPPPPSRLRAGLPPALDAICRLALAKKVPQRYASAAEMAHDLEAFLEQGRSEHATSTRPLVAAESIAIDFAPYATRAPDSLHDTLYLDIGGDLRPGVIDHHHLYYYPGSAARLLVHRLALVDDSVRRDRRLGDPFTLILHQEPDLDALLSAYLARHYLSRRTLPAGTAVLCEYLDGVDAGHPGFTMRHRFTPYTAFFVLRRRAEQLESLSPAERWRWAVLRGFDMLDRVCARAPGTLADLWAIDAFAPTLFTAADRNLIDADHERYQRKLKDRRTAARQASLSLPVQAGSGRDSVPALLVRHVQDGNDPDACLFFKDWARTDQARVQNRPGFVALSVFMDLGRSWKVDEQTGPLGRAIISVTPASEVSLRGLGRRLEEAERDRRIALFAKDDRDFDAAGQPRPPRRGYHSPDPWYDGRAHHFTIIDAPACGSVLTADEIEGILLEYGQAAGRAMPLLA
jgi:serine/threonine-protein kinase